MMNEPHLVESFTGLDNDYEYDAAIDFHWRLF